MGTYPILAYVYFIWKINFQNKRENRIEKLIALSFMFSVFYSNCNVFFYSLQDNKLRLMIISLKLKVIMEWT
jgi:hypothetical protein